MSAEDEEAINEKEAYFESLRTWSRQVQTAQLNAFMPYYLMAHQMLFNSSPPFFNNNYRPPPPPPPPSFYPRFRMAPDNVANGPARPADGIEQGQEFVVPPIWKRVVAEVLDFFFFLVSKLLLYYVADNYFGLLLVLETKSISGIRSMNLLKQFGEDYDLNLELTSEIILLELLNRLVACMFETLFISDCLMGPRWGGTPGKFVMGLRVVSATAVVTVPDRPRPTVMVYPGSSVTFKTALLRSALKNALISLIFPVCMFTFFVQHNRTTYDVMANVIVVESGPDDG